jgi:hypothetical protein
MGKSQLEINGKICRRAFNPTYLEYLPIRLVYMTWDNYIAPNGFDPGISKYELPMVPITLHIFQGI